MPKIVVTKLGDQWFSAMTDMPHLAGIEAVSTNQHGAIGRLLCNPRVQTTLGITVVTHQKDRLQEIIASDYVEYEVLGEPLVKSARPLSPIEVIRCLRAKYSFGVVEACAIWMNRETLNVAYN